MVIDKNTINTSIKRIVEDSIALIERESTHEACNAARIRNDQGVVTREEAPHLFPDED